MVGQVPKDLSPLPAVILVPKLVHLASLAVPRDTDILRATYECLETWGNTGIADLGRAGGSVVRTRGKD